VLKDWGLGLWPDGVYNFLGSFLGNVGPETPYFRIRENHIFRNLQCFPDLICVMFPSLQTQCNIPHK
jgi:hypothetical protein